MTTVAYHVPYSSHIRSIEVEEEEKKGGEKNEKFFFPFFFERPRPPLCLHHQDAIPRRPLQPKKARFCHFLR